MEGNGVYRIHGQSWDSCVLAFLDLSQWLRQLSGPHPAIRTFRSLAQQCDAARSFSHRGLVAGVGLLRRASDGNTAVGRRGCLPINGNCCSAANACAWFLEQLRSPVRTDPHDVNNCYCHGRLRCYTLCVAGVSRATKIICRPSGGLPAMHRAFVHALP